MKICRAQSNSSNDNLKMPILPYICQEKLAILLTIVSRTGRGPKGRMLEMNE